MQQFQKTAEEKQELKDRKAAYKAEQRELANNKNTRDNRHRANRG